MHGLMHGEMRGDVERSLKCFGEGQDAFPERDCGAPEGRGDAVALPLADVDSPAAAARRQRESEAGGQDCEAAGVNGERQIAQGTLKWFSLARGYGFVALQDFDEDALLHALCLKQAGRENIARGARVTCRVARRPKGIQVIRLLSIDESGDFAFACPEQLQQAGAFERAVVKWFDSRRGYGFVSTGEGMLDIFVHSETLQRCKMDCPKSGDEIMVRFWRGPRGLSASEVRCVGAQEPQEDMPAAPARTNGTDGLPPE